MHLEIIHSRECELEGRSLNLLGVRGDRGRISLYETGEGANEKEGDSRRAEGPPSPQIFSKFYTNPEMLNMSRVLFFFLFQNCEGAESCDQRIIIKADI